MAEEEDRWVHQVKAGLEKRTDGGKSAPNSPSRSTTRARHSKQQASARLTFDTSSTTLRRETLGDPLQTIVPSRFQSSMR